MLVHPTRHVRSSAVGGSGFYRLRHLFNALSDPSGAAAAAHAVRCPGRFDQLRVSREVAEHSLNKPMHDARPILGILAGFVDHKRLQYDVRTIFDPEFGMLRVSRGDYESTSQ